MELKGGNIGGEVLLLLHRERCLRHQLRLAGNRQRDVALKDSPEEIRMPESHLGPIRLNREKSADEPGADERIASKRLGKDVRKARSYVRRNTSVMGRLGEWEAGSDFREIVGDTDRNSREILRSDL